jgi:hypothetical protein
MDPLTEIINKKNSSRRKKKMRKSFILSLVMVVVLIASLATATFAWYTSQTQVNVDSTTLYTASTDASLVISDHAVDDIAFTNDTVTLTLDRAGGVGSGLVPMVIDAEDNDAITSSTTYGSFAFLSTTLKAGSKAGLAGTAANPAKIATVDDDIDSTGTAIYVANPGKSAATYGVKVTISSAASNKGLRVAVFGGSAATADASLTLVGIWAPTGETAGVIDAIPVDTEWTSGLGFEGETQYTCVESNTAVGGQTLAAYNGTIANNKYLVVAWFDGKRIDNSFAETVGSFTISFEIGAGA